MKNKVVLFGAGNNCRGIIKFLGKENIFMIIDNDIRKWGTQIEKIPVISLDKYKSYNVSYPILITISKGTEQLENQLQAVDIHQYYFAPFIQFGFYKNAKMIIACFEMSKVCPVFWGNNPITDKIIQELIFQNLPYKILNCNEENYPLLNQQEEAKNIISINELASDDIIYVTDAKKHNFAFLDNKFVDILDVYRKQYLPKHNELKKFKNIHYGKRCFLIGNGPSLMYDDLEQLKKHNEITFGVNRIYKSFDKTTWRPNYYVIVDSIMIHQDLKVIQKYDFPVIFVGDNYSENKIEDKGNYYFSRMPNAYNLSSFSENITEYIYGGNTVIYDAMQIAVYMGFSEIILLGVDMTFTKQGENIPHFYKSNEKEDNNFTKGNIKNIMETFSIARTIMERKGIKIKNATRGGNLEVLERIEFDKLFDK